MSDEKKRLDESLSSETFLKSLTGNIDVEINPDAFSISNSGILQPNTSNQGNASSSENGKNEE